MPSRSDLRRRARRTSAVSAIAFAVVAMSFPLWSGLLARAAAGRIEVASSRFRARQVEIVGLHRLSRETVESLAAVSLGRPLLQIPCRETERRVMSHPWIRHAFVRRRLPSTIEIRVVEREPAAAMRGDSLLVITTDSVAVAPLAGWVWDLPLLTPAHSQSVRAGARLADRGTLALLGEALKVRAISLGAWRNLSELYYHNGEMVAALSDPPLELLLGDGAPQLQWAAALGYLHARVGAQAAPLRRIDLRIPGELVVTQGTSQTGEQISG